MAVEPDLAGFAEAQSRLRQKLGQDVAFYGPVTLTFPANTPLDPETGQPYDPTISGSAASASGMVRCSVKRDVIHTQTVDTAAGIGGATHVVLLADDTPANRAVILPAESFVVTSAAFKVERTKLDPPVREAGRIVVFGRAK